MTLITDTWRQLVQRRLWPLALLLVAALVAVPMLLTKSPAPAAPAPLPSGTGAAAPADDAATGTPVVALATSADTRRHVLGARKDPFRPAIVAKAAPAPKSTPSTPAQTGANSTGGSSGTGGSGTGGSPAVTPVSPGPVATTPAPVKKTFPADSLTVRFGKGGDSKSILRKGEALPSTDASSPDATPLLVYLGTAKSGKEAVFLLDASVKADGDGHCDSSAANTCGTLHMRAGDTEFLDVTDDTGKVTGQYELDLVAIHARPVAKTARAARHSLAATARAAIAGAASAGRASLGAGVAALLGSL